MVSLFSCTADFLAEDDSFLLSKQNLVSVELKVDPLKNVETTQEVSDTFDNHCLMCIFLRNENLWPKRVCMLKGLV